MAGTTRRSPFRSASRHENTPSGAVRGSGAGRRTRGVASMGEAKIGEEFIKHELDEAIAIQRTIVDAAQQLSESHPFDEAKRVIKTGLKEDRRYLTELEKLGREHGAT